MQTASSAHTWEAWPISRRRRPYLKRVYRCAEKSQFGVAVVSQRLVVDAADFGIAKSTRRALGRTNGENAKIFASVVTWSRLPALSKDQIRKLRAKLARMPPSELNAEYRKYHEKCDINLCKDTPQDADIQTLVQIWRALRRWTGGQR